MPQRWRWRSWHRAEWFHVISWVAHANSVEKGCQFGIKDETSTQFLNALSAAPENAIRRQSKTWRSVSPNECRR